MSDLTATRESWLNDATEMFRPRFVEIGFPLPEKIRISVGWGSIGARQENAKILGVTFVRSVSADGVNEVFISPEHAEAFEMLITLLHELCHVADDCQSGHRGDFAEMATRLGFVGPMTETPPSIELAAEMVTMAAALGEYPGAPIKLPSRKPAPVPADAPVPAGVGGGPVKWSSGPGVQGTRMIKVSCQHDGCPAFGYTTRLTRKWLASFGAPICPFFTGTDDMHRLSE